MSRRQRTPSPSDSLFSTEDQDTAVPKTKKSRHASTPSSSTEESSSNQVLYTITVIVVVISDPTNHSASWEFIFSKRADVAERGGKWTRRGAENAGDLDGG